MDLIRLSLDAVVLIILCIAATRTKKERLVPILYAAGLFFMISEVYFIYRGQENSDLFFWHAYIAWTAGNLAVIIFRLLKKENDKRKLLLERGLLWQVVVVTVFAGFILCVGWLMKLYIRTPKPAVTGTASELVSEEKKEPYLNTYSDLSVPTQITKIDGTYFLVDCYHDRIIYSDDINLPLTSWYVLTDEMKMGHTIAGDGHVFLADDTENNRLMVFERDGEGFRFTQEFRDVGDRPHCVIYDEDTDSFYAWISSGGKMHILKRSPEDNRMYLCDTKYIKELDGVYVRSFTIMDDEIYFPAGDGRILCVDKDSFEIKKTYPVDDSIGGMIQLSKIDDMYYLTVSTDIVGFQNFATIVRCRDLETLEKGGWEDVYSSFIGGGTPYYITSFDDAYYLVEHRLPGHSVWRFTVEDGKIEAETIF